MTADAKMRNYLADVTDALQVGDDVDVIREQHGISGQTSEEFTKLITRLNQAYVEVTPSAEFSQRLKAELLHEQKSGLVWRIRRLPARVQFAASAALLGGFMLILRRTVSGATQVDESAGVEEMSIIH